MNNKLPADRVEFPEGVLAVSLSERSEDPNYNSLSSKIEIHISNRENIAFSEQGAAFCEFEPCSLNPCSLSPSRSGFMPDLGFLEGTCSSATIIYATKSYLTAEGGYPEMYPGDDFDY